jgi:hypothetical protein
MTELKDRSTIAAGMGPAAFPLVIYARCMTMKVSFENVNGELFLVVTGRENGIESYKAKIHKMEDANGLRRFTVVCEYEYEMKRKDDVLGFITVDVEELPLRTRFAAVMTNVQDKLDAAKRMKSIMRNRKLTWAERWKRVKKELRDVLPSQFRLGVVKAEDSNLPLWAGAVTIAEENPNERDTLGYWPRSKRTKELSWALPNLGDFAYAEIHYSLEEQASLAKIWRYEIKRTEWEKIADSVYIRYFHNGVTCPWNKSNLLIYLTIPFDHVAAKSVDVQRAMTNEVPNRRRSSKVTA